MFQLAVTFHMEDMESVIFDKFIIECLLPILGVGKRM